MDIITIKRLKLTIAQTIKGVTICPEQIEVSYQETKLDKQQNSFISRFTYLQIHYMIRYKN